MVLAQLSPSVPVGGSLAAATAPASRRRRRTPWVVAACLLALSFLALSLRMDDQQVATNDASESAVGGAPAAPAVTDLRELVTELDLWDAGIIDSIDQTSIGLHFFTREIDSLEPLLRALEFSPTTMDRIGSTRAIDGTLTATAPHATASWSFEPDDGLRVVIRLPD